MNMTHQELIEELSKNNRFRQVRESININSTDRIHTFAINFDSTFKIHYIEFNLLDSEYSDENKNRELAVKEFNRKYDTLR